MLPWCWSTLDIPGSTECPVAGVDVQEEGALCNGTEEPSAGCCFTPALCFVVIYCLLPYFATEGGCFSMPDFSGLAELPPFGQGSFGLGWFVPWGHLLVNWTAQKGKNSVQNQPMVVFLLRIRPGTSGECQDFLMQSLACTWLNWLMLRKCWISENPLDQPAQTWGCRDPGCKRTAGDADLAVKAEEGDVIFTQSEVFFRNCSIKV